MSGLTMCSTMGCPLRALCLRFMAPPSVNQVWDEWTPKGKTCRGFVPVKKGKTFGPVKLRELAAKTSLGVMV
ncbi:MAG: hypothetical protein AAB036_01655 [Elusimicrobiota bacterium]